MNAKQKRNVRKVGIMIPALLLILAIAAGMVFAKTGTSAQADRFRQMFGFEHKPTATIETAKTPDPTASPPSEPQYSYASIAPQSGRLRRRDGNI
jgi:flagellar basal body-associated protein FliL